MRAERPKKPVAEPVTPSPSAPPPAPPTLPRQVAQIREFTRPAEGRRPSSLRHTGLLRPVSALDPGVVRLTPEKSAGALPDSARSETGRTDGLGGTTGGSGTGEQEHWRN